MMGGFRGDLGPIQWEATQSFFAWGGLELVRSGFGLHPRWVGLFLRLARFMAVDDDGCVCVGVCVGVVTFIDREYYYDMFVSITITIITACTL